MAGPDWGGGTMMRAATRRSVLASGASLVAMPALAAAHSGLKLRLAHSLPRSHPIHPALEFMAERVRERSGGAVWIEIFADGDLGQEVQLVEHLRAGRIDIAKVSASVLERRVPTYRIFDIPFLFRDDAHRRAAVAGAVGEEILASGTDLGLVGVGFYEAGTRSFYGREPIMAPEDLRGLRVRIQPSPTMARLIRALDGIPSELPWAATFSALQTEYARVLGAAPASLQGAGPTFGQVPARWYEEPEANAVALQTAYSIAFDGCLTFTATAPEFAAAPDASSAPVQCAALARRFWSKTPAPQEIQSCVDVAVTAAASEPNARRKWAYACASVLSSAGFLTY